MPLEKKREQRSLSSVIPAGSVFAQFTRLAQRAAQWMAARGDEERLTASRREALFLQTEAAIWTEWGEAQSLYNLPVQVISRGGGKKPELSWGKELAKEDPQFLADFADWIWAGHQEKTALNSDKVGVGRASASATASALAHAATGSPATPLNGEGQAGAESTERQRRRYVLETVTSWACAYANEESQFSFDPEDGGAEIRKANRAAVHALCKSTAGLSFPSDVRGAAVMNALVKDAITRDDRELCAVLAGAQIRVAQDAPKRMPSGDEDADDGSHWRNARLAMYGLAGDTSFADASEAFKEYWRQEINGAREKPKAGRVKQMLQGSLRLVEGVQQNAKVGRSGIRAAACRSLVNHTRRLIREGAPEFAFLPWINDLVADMLRHEQIRANFPKETAEEKRAFVAAAANVLSEIENPTFRSQVLAGLGEKSPKTQREEYAARNNSVGFFMALTDEQFSELEDFALQCAIQAWGFEAALGAWPDYPNPGAVGLSVQEKKALRETVDGAKNGHGGGNDARDEKMSEAGGVGIGGGGGVRVAEGASRGLGMSIAAEETQMAARTRKASRL